MSDQPIPTGYWAPITDEATARDAVKMGGLPILALGVSLIFLARTAFVSTTMPLALVALYLAAAAVFIVFAFRIRSGRAASLPYLAALFFGFVLVELVLSFVYPVGSVDLGWSGFSIILNHLVTFLAAALAYRGLRGWRFLRRANVPMRL